MSKEKMYVSSCSKTRMMNEPVAFWQSVFGYIQISHWRFNHIKASKTLLAPLLFKSFHKIVKMHFFLWNQGLLKAFGHVCDFPYSTGINNLSGTINHFCTTLFILSNQFQIELYQRWFFGFAGYVDLSVPDTEHVTVHEKLEYTTTICIYYLPQIPNFPLIHTHYITLHCYFSVNFTNFHKLWAQK